MRVPMLRIVTVILLAASSLGGTSTMQYCGSTEVVDGGIYGDLAGSGPVKPACTVIPINIDFSSPGAGAIGLSGDCMGTTWTTGDPKMGILLKFDGSATPTTAGPTQRDCPYVSQVINLPKGAQNPILNIKHKHQFEHTSLNQTVFTWGSIGLFDTGTLMTTKELNSTTNTTRLSFASTQTNEYSARIALPIDPGIPLSGSPEIPASFRIGLIPSAFLQNYASMKTVQWYWTISSATLEYCL